MISLSKKSKFIDSYFHLFFQINDTLKSLVMKKNIMPILLSSYLSTFFIAGIPNNSAAQNKSDTPGTFSHPSWSEQSNIYEVNLRQFTPSSSIKEFEKSLPRLRKMGIEILWFMPLTPIGIEGRKMT